MADLAPTIVEFNGPILAGTLVYECLFGATVVLAFEYLTWYKDDGWMLKSLVSWQMLMGAIQGGLLFHVLWFKSIDGWGQEASIFTTSQTGNLTNVTTLFIIVPSQLFFASVAFRALGRSYLFLVPVGTAILVVLASGLGLCVELIFKHKTFENLIVLPNIYLWGLASVEVVLTTVLCIRFKFLQSRAGEELRNLLTSFIFLSLRTSLATASVAVFERICHATGHGLLAQAPGLFLAGIANISLLHTLNSRRQLQQRAGVSDHASEEARATNASRFGRGKVNSNAPHEIRVDTIVLTQLDDGTNVKRPVPGPTESTYSSKGEFDNESEAPFSNPRVTFSSNAHEKA